MKRIFLICLSLLALGYIVFGSLLFFYQRSFLYFPTPESKTPGSTSFSLTNDGETIRIWSRTVESSYAVIYFGGNSEDVSNNFMRFSSLLPDQNLYFVNYRGYGGSSGTPSEAALFSDALAVYDSIREKHANISVIGRSLGSGVAVYLAANRKVDKLVLVTPYDSIENVAKKRFPIFPISLLLQDKFNSASRVQNITAKTLVILAENDEVIPRANSYALTARFPPQQLEIKVVLGTTHDSIGRSPEYFDIITGFL